MSNSKNSGNDNGFFFFFFKYQQLQKQTIFLRQTKLVKPTVSHFSSSATTYSVWRRILEDQASLPRDNQSVR